MKEKIKNCNFLSRWQKEEFEYLFKEYPEVLEMGEDELENFSRRLYFQAGNLLSEVNRLESHAENIKSLITLRRKLVD